MTDEPVQACAEWSRQLVGVAAAEGIVEAVERAFEAISGALHLDHGALLLIDDEGPRLVAATAGFDRALPVATGDGEATLTALRDAFEVVCPLLGEHEGQREVWGAVVTAPTPGNDISADTREMIDAVASMLGVVVRRIEAVRLLEESNHRLETYTHAAAHDLRSPLRRIRSFSQVLQTRLLADEIDRDQLCDFADRIARGAEGLDTLLVSLLERSTTGPLAAEREGDVRGL